jgi:hypothetical protein
MKYKHSYYKVPGVNFEKHFLVGYVWHVRGSTGNTYEVELMPQGFDCSCIGFAHHGKCKHIKEVCDHVFADRVPEYRYV